MAVKIFRPRATGAASVDRLEEEVRRLASLQHHSLIPVLDTAVLRSDRDEPRIVLVMELAENSDLRSKLVHGPLAVQDIAHLAHDLAEGLEYLHARGMVHRDIKPSNVFLVDYNGDNSRTRARLADFGVAQLADAPADVTAAGDARYRSPEVARREPAGPASDVYALGQVLLECFSGIADPSAEPAHHRQPGSPSADSRSVPFKWAALIDAMTADDPEDRPLVPDLVLALRQLIIGAPGRHRAEAPPQLGATPPLVRPSAPPSADEEGRMSAVRRYDLLDTPPDRAFDTITALAARIFAVPIALVTVVDHDRIWFKSRQGLDVQQIDRDPGLCASAILHDEPWVVTNARMDPRTLANPLVAGEMGLQFYAGAQLVTRDGYNLGTMCVLDYQPREFTVGERATLHDLAAMVMSELELRLEKRQVLLDRLEPHDG